MRICFFNDQRLGLVDNNQVRDISEILKELPAHAYPYPRHDLLIAALPELHDKITALAATAPAIALDQVTLLSPVQNPGKIVAAPVNYQKHLEEAIEDTATFSRAHVRKIQETGLFLKATHSLVGASEGIELQLLERRTDHEIELAVIIGKTCRNVDYEDALAQVAGYCIGLDITIRGPEERSLRKSLDTYTVLGPWLVTADELSDPSQLEMTLLVNDEQRQHANTRDLILDVADLIVFASKFYTLEPGDILLTGTPEGVAPIHPGDKLCASIDKIGTIDVEVKPIVS
ncbi:fumarylacetoacetate hydrolase family protein [Oceanobacter antarcticus]|uniref:Fumarylacetoacetate hydrolase family protein n=1 Tax=Oceanobacter antarcticus TaxID=3133425 RepID=A0ABW8NH22_9GAMM